MALLPEGTIQSPPHQLTKIPRYLTTFVGRSAELSALKSMLATSQLVTLIGAGGSGKTRLAAELGRACLDLWPGGVCWVELAPVDDPLQVPDVVATALQVPGRGQTQDVLAALLAARRAVLFLDNCEHLVAACAALSQAALERCPELTIIATSREVLGVPGEVRWSVSSMPSTEAMQLFEARAQLVLPDFKVTASNLDAVTQICDRLDGMPLAIELAAARLDMLTEHELLSQLSDRFGLLKAASRTAPQRQQTMMATIDWSYRLLTEDEALLFRRLSVFRGGFTLESAQAVCGHGIATSLFDILAGLVRKSMVVAERAEGQRSRYRLLESQLAYAEDRLRETGELELVRRRHYEYLQECLAARTIWPPTPNWVSGFPDWVAQEWGNLWAAVGWARHNAEDLGLSLAVDFGPRHSTQARRRLADLLSHSPAQGAVRVSALCRATMLAWTQGDYQEAIEAAESAVAIAREVGGVDLLAWALNCLGMSYRFRGDVAAAAEIYGEATSLLKGSTNLRLVCVVRDFGAYVASDAGDYVGAAALLAECVPSARAEGDVFWHAVFLHSLARAQLGMRDHQAAGVSWMEAISIIRRLDFFNLVDCIGGLSCVAAAIGDDHRALRLAGAASHLADKWSLHSDPWLQKEADAAVQRSRSRLGVRKSEEAWKEGWAMSADHAIDYALGESEPQKRVDPGPLSPRELDIVKLVAAGMTNRQIAERLFIAERTVDGHLEHVREKLAVNTRAQIAAWTVEHGLASGRS